MTNANTARWAEIDAVLRLVDRELWVVTSAAGGCRGGLLASWVSSAAIDPQRPVLLAGLAPNHFTAELVQESNAFAAHLLRPDQIDLAWNFAQASGRERDKLAGLDVEVKATGAPVLADCLAWCDCRAFARYDAGDRLLFWADVVAAGFLGDRTSSPTIPPAQPTSRPLREQAFFQALGPDRCRELLAARDADIAIHAPLHARWRNQFAPA